MTMTRNLLPHRKRRHKRCIITCAYNLLSSYLLYQLRLFFLLKIPQIINYIWSSLCLQDSKQANSPDYSPSRPEVTPSPKVRADAMKRPGDDDGAAESLLKQRAAVLEDDAALQRLQLERQLEQQRLKRRLEEQEELARLSGKSLRCTSIFTAC